jgi:hypothetical protein
MSGENEKMAVSLSYVGALQREVENTLIRPTMFKEAWQAEQWLREEWIKPELVAPSTNQRRFAIIDNTGVMLREPLLVGLIYNMDGFFYLRWIWLRLKLMKKR